MEQEQILELEERLLSDIIEFQKVFKEPYYIFVPKDEIKNPKKIFSFYNIYYGEK